MPTNCRFWNSFRIFIFILLFLLGLCSVTQASLTKSIGYPFNGRLENGIPFPRVFKGYILRDSNSTYTTPEVIWALLETFDKMKKTFPETCALYLGDFSRPGGGPWYPAHKSHQNGRDVDIGMYAKGNIQLNGFVPMNAENLDAKKTLTFIAYLIDTGFVEHIFLDIEIQKILYKYALLAGVNKKLLDILFQAGENYYNTIVRHEPNHKDHMHVRFKAPWSALASYNLTTVEKQALEIIQKSFLPYREIYTVKRKTNIEEIAKLTKVSSDLIAYWNGLYKKAILSPGTPLVLYKRGINLPSKLHNILPSTHSTQNTVAKND